MNRRKFLGLAAASTAAVGRFGIVPSGVLGQDAPSETLRIGCIGNGRMGRGDMLECLQQGLTASGRAHIVAVCDVDSSRALQAQRTATETYKRRLPPGKSIPNIQVFDDYRELLARDDIDGVTISTPDHWHAGIAIAAAAAGKDIYLQKPLTYTIVEGQKLVQAVRRNHVVLQAGTQQRSSDNFRNACELVRNGRIGKLHTIEVRLPADSGVGNANAVSVPKNLNFDRWLGPSALAPYSPDRVHPQDGLGRPGWLQIEAYSRGMITGWGSHMFDIAQWGHGSDDSGLTEVEATADFPDRGLFDVHTNFRSLARYADGVRLLAQTGEPAGVKFLGDEGWIDVGRSRLAAESPGILQEPSDQRKLRLYQSDQHMLDFLQSMRSRRDPVCPVEVAHRANSICVITHIAMKLKRKLRWDPVGERFVDDETANGLLDYTHRAPWTV
jgi:predicted dehydrogenase